MLNVEYEMMKDALKKMLSVLTIPCLTCTITQSIGYNIKHLIFFHIFDIALFDFL